MDNTDNNIYSGESIYTEREEEMYESFRKLMSEPDYRPLKFKDLCSYYEVEDGEEG